MFSNKALIESQRELSAANAKIVILERELAIQRANFDWLAAHVNELKAERAILLDRVLEVQVPVMSIAREPVQVEVPRAEPRLTPEALADKVAFMPPPQGERGTIFRPRTADEPTSAQMAEAIAAGDLFNDVGDDRAREMGLGWDEEGRLQTDLPRAVARSR